MDVEDYACLKNTEFTDGLFTLRSLRFQEMELIRKWRNEQIVVLRQQKPITALEQASYYRNQVLQEKLSKRPKNLLLAIFKGVALIGYGGLVHLNWHKRSGEVSFLLDPRIMSDEIEYENAFTSFLSLIEKVAKEELDLTMITSETFSFRQRHIEIMEEFGFRKVAELKDSGIANGKTYNSIFHEKKIIGT